MRVVIILILSDQFFSILKMTSFLLEKIIKLVFYHIFVKQIYFRIVHYFLISYYKSLIMKGKNKINKKTRKEKGRAGKKGRREWHFCYDTVSLGHQGANRV